MQESEEASVIDALEGINGPGAVSLAQQLVAAIEALAASTAQIAATLKPPA